MSRIVPCRLDSRYLIDSHPSLHDAGQWGVHFSILDTENAAECSFTGYPGEDRTYATETEAFEAGIAEAELRIIGQRA